VFELSSDGFEAGLWVSCEYRGGSPDCMARTYRFNFSLETFV